MKVRFEETHRKWGITAFLVLLAAILVFFIIYRFDVIWGVLGVVIAILTPFIYGLVFAYLLCPVYNFITSCVYSFLGRRKGRLKRRLTVAKGVGTFVSILLLLLVVAGVCWMIIPGIVDSIVHVAKTLPESRNQFMAWLNKQAANYPFAKDTLEAMVNQISAHLTDYLEQKMIPGYMEIATKISTGVYGVLVVLKNFFIGIIICGYFLNSKETFAAQSKKLLFAFFKRERAVAILDGATFTNRTFGGFINGKLLDSLIIGILCFIFMTLFGWEYPLLISCIIGITNIIPFFGPFIGAIPSILLLLMVAPMQALYFGIFVLILQQFDGSILGPKILGDSTGLASFWVMFAILVGGGLFGFVGMIVGIPVFAVLYAYFAKGINRRLAKRNCATDIASYTVYPYGRKGKK